MLSAYQYYTCLKKDIYNKIDVWNINRILSQKVQLQIKCMCKFLSFI